MEKTDEKIRVLCAISGGVDSAVAAFLLKKAGFDVIGVFMKFWVDDLGAGEAQSANLDCMCDARRRAELTAGKLGIPFHVLDFSDEFKKKVVGDFLKGTQNGLTPNPCVVCNKAIKFGRLLKKAKELGAARAATGHYARIKLRKDGIFELLKGKDKEKDQSYYLWQLTQKELSKIIFPLGEFTKAEVRAAAQELALPSRDTPESQEACFAPAGTDVFLSKRLAARPGDIVDSFGKKIGTHDGLWHYTIGQRKGIKLSGGPYYVVSKNAKANVLAVSKRKSDLSGKTAILGGLNWTAGICPKLPLSVKVKIRSRSKAAAGLIKKKKGLVCLEFARPQPAITPGQSAVFYQGSRLIGGGFIAR
ncbi:MAG TPA: tRNA 2-thiouridine(34) synthase MnmA [Candidatus Paceibacterota bacterium]|nr:tRNA 2-thiouridine(34) synthase MnmA [Candidatus Pacearchaeota archaeon]HRZ50487.1 tRNA 2-thiouridine(34) synthase MnmA [Candidatus Paceibacterota bacterium]HSA36208.1 tRNA 2-thiouridine(34) synthase MnmA [Candidatus Paceibacterota bacterium]